MAKKTLTTEERLKKRERELRKQANKLNKQLSSTTRNRQKATAQKDFMDYIIEQYGMIYIPAYVSRKIVSVNEGTYSGLTKGIPYEDLLGMFKFSQKKIDEIRIRKWRNGEKLDNISQFNYDLAIVLGDAAAYYDYVAESKIKLEQSLNQLSDKLETTMIKQEIYQKKKRIAELEKTKKQDEATLAELFSDF